MVLSLLQVPRGWQSQLGCQSNSSRRRLPCSQLHGFTVSCQLESEAFRDLPRPKKTARLEPSFYLSREDALEVQLKALQNNNFPTLDHGIEVLYRFAGFNPFERSRFFGVSLDLGQFERFRRIFYTPCYAPLLTHSSHLLLSSLEVSEGVWKARVLVQKQYYKSTDEHVYEFTMAQRLGGKYDGVWFTENLICDGCDDRQLYGVI